MLKPLYVSFVSVLFIFAWLHVAIGGENRVVVQPFTNVSGDRDLIALGEGFADLLSATLATYDEIQVVEREHLHNVVRELGYQLSGLKENDVKKIGNLLQANRFIKGGFVHVRGKLHINVHVFDIETTRLLTSLEREGELKNVHQLASSLAEELAFKLINNKSLSKPALMTEQPEVNLHYMKGLGAFYSGLYDHAIAEFMQVLDQDPTHANARYWLAKSYLEGGEKAHSKIEFKRFLEAFPSDKRVADIKKILPDL
ncbi:MAG: tetratricopeptide repeat protein [bacterium]|nr:tetratricopeptide repeat protein [bacterium]